ncbi:MAG: response regulator [Saprospiraceae bacterium]|nr:response regulator [Saprospiraceae bacterium]
MIESLKILVVEDEMIIGAEISMYLEQIGHEVIGLLPRAEDVIPFIESNKPQLVLLDIRLKGTLDGIDIAGKIKSLYDDIPIIFLTANSDDFHFNRASATRPEAFISKPFTKKNLHRAVALVASKLSEHEINPTSGEVTLLDDRVFIYDKGKRDRVFTKDIFYLEADRNYSKIYTDKKEFILSINLKSIEEKLPPEIFIRVHRSYIINIHAIESILDSQLLVKGKSIPLAKGMRAALLEKLRVL